MRVYLSYPIILYRCSKNYIHLLRTIFGEDIEIVDPSQYENRHGNINFYLNLIKDVDAVVYVPFLGFITAGVLMKLCMLFVEERESTDYLVIRYVK